MCDSFTSNDFWKEFLALEKPREESLEALSGLLSKEKVSIYGTTGSTNTEILKSLNENFYSKGLSLLSEGGSSQELTKEGLLFHKSLVAAAEQTAGRGRLGRKFYSPAKSGIYFSFAYVQKGGVKNPALYTITSAVGVCRAIKKLFGIECSIKWVNDVYIGEKKVCGILTEGITNPKNGIIECAVVGIGINISVNENLPDELRDKAGGILGNSLDKEKTAASRAKLLAYCIHEILKSLDSSENIIEEYKSLSMLTGRTVTVSPTIGEERGCYRAKVLGISDNAALLVQKEDGKQCELNSGEVSLSLK